MEIVEGRVALLSNYEVLAVLRDQQQVRGDAGTTIASNRTAENVKTVEFETLSYLNDSPCATQTPEQVAELMSALSQFALTKAERLQILNLRPRQAVEIHMLIEECDERFEMNTLEAMLELVRKHLPRDDD
ncbi:RNA polymerase II, partial [Thamnocephalis sphaerospora]